MKTKNKTLTLVSLLRRSWRETLVSLDIPVQSKALNIKTKNKVKLKTIALVPFLFLVANCFSQTSPTPFNLSSGSFSFNSQTASSTTYPTNLQGWNNGGSSNPTSLPTAASTANISLTASGTSASVGISNLGINGFQLLSSSGSTTIGSIALSLNTLGRSNVQVSWVAADQTTGSTRQTNLTLQYRLGTTGAFTTVSNATYTTSNTSAASAVTFNNIALPSECENKAIVHLRWIYYESPSQSGNRDAIRLDDILVTSALSSIPSLSVTGTANLGSVCVNSSSQQTYTITNFGATANNIIVSSDNAQYVVSNLSSSTVAASGGTTTFTVTYSPTSAGAASSNINVYYDTNTLAVSSVLSGSGTASSIPIVNSVAAVSITTNSATIKGDLTSLGTCPAATSKGFVYALTSDNSNPVNGGFGVTNTVVSGITTGAFSLSIASLSANKSYSYRPYAYDGVAYTYGVATTFTTLPNASSDVIAVSGSEPSTISSLVNDSAPLTNATGVEVWQFRVRDGGLNSTDTDNLPTNVSAITIARVNSGIDYLANIKSAAIFDANNNFVATATSITASSIVFTGLSISVANNSSALFKLRISLNNILSPSASIDGSDFGFSISNSNITAGTNSSGFTSFAAAQSTDAKNIISVIASKLEFVQQPVDTYVNVTMNPSVSVSANDANGNRDIDYVSNINIISSGTLSVSPSIVTASAGLATYSALTHTVTGNLITLQATSGSLINKTSTTFTISEGPSSLSQGDLAILAFGTTTTDKFAFVLLKDINTGTIINFTDNGFSSTSTGRTGEGFLTYTAPTAICAGTVITWINGQSIVGTGWSSNNPTNFAFNSTGDQLFAFQGTANSTTWASQSGITLLSGIQNYNTSWIMSGTASAATSYNPSNLGSSYKVQFPTFSDSYFTATTLTNTKSNILATINNSSNYTTSNSAITLPSYALFVVYLDNFSVTTTPICPNTKSLITVNCPNLSNGIYTATYSIVGYNTVNQTTAQLTISSGTGTFETPLLLNEGNSTIIITKLNYNGCDKIIVSGGQANVLVNVETVLNSQDTHGQMICSNGQFTAINVIATGTNLTYQWYKNTQNSNSGGDLIDLATTATYSPEKIGSPFYYYCVISGSCGIVTSQASGPFVIAQSNAGTITATQNLCNNSSASDISINGYSGSILKWQSSTDSNFSNPIDINNTTNTISGSSLGLITSTMYYRAVVQNGTCEIVYSNPSGLIVKTTTYSNGSWDNGTPDSLTTAIIESNFVSNSDFSACSLLVTNGASVTISSGFNITLQQNLVVNTGSTFTLENTANMIQNSIQDNVGNVNIKRDSSPLYRLDYTMWSSPVSGTQKMTQFTPLTSLNRFYTYTTLTKSLTSIVPSTSTFEIGKGYLIRMPNTWIAYGNGNLPASWTGTFVGVPNNGNVTVQISNEGERYNAVGNPYPSAINIDSFLNQNNNDIEGTIWLWRKTNDNKSQTIYYTTCTSYGCNVENNHTYSDDNLLSVGQGFFVKALEGKNSLQFNNGMRSLSTVNQFFRKTQKDRFWLNLSNTSGVNLGQMMIGYTPEATLGYDNGMDGLQMNDNIKTSLSSIVENKEIVIETRPNFDSSDIVKLKFKTDLSDTYVISLNKTEGLFLENQDVIIKDNFLGVEQSLKASNYTFVSQSGDFENRFEIVYQEKLDLDDNIYKNDIKLFNTENTLQINSENEKIEKVVLFDIRGREIFMKENVDDNISNIDISAISNGIILVKIVTEKRILTKKIIK